MGAKTGGNEYVSALLCDSNNNVLYYGNIARDSANDTATLNIPSGLAAGNYTLKIFSEQCNGDYKTDYASALQEITLTILPKEATPQASFTATDDDSGTLSNVESGMKYSTDGGASWNEIAGMEVELTGVTAANDVKIYQPGNGTTTGDSDVQTIDITQADKPAVNGADCTTIEQNDGKITDDDSTMEYRLSTSSEWTEITGTEVTGLSDGAYDVRVKANGTALASETVTVTIGEHTCVGQGEWQCDTKEHWNTCACGEKMNEAAHTFEWVTDKEATATEAGSKHEECTVCGYEKAAVEIPAAGTTEEPSEPPTDTDKPDGDQTGNKDNPGTGTTDSPQAGDTSSPQTGDDSNIALWIGVMLAAGAALTGTVLSRHRRK